MQYYQSFSFGWSWVLNGDVSFTPHVCKLSMPQKVVTVTNAWLGLPQSMQTKKDSFLYFFCFFFLITRFEVIIGTSHLLKLGGG